MKTDPMEQAAADLIAALRTGQIKKQEQHQTQRTANHNASGR